MIKKLLLLVFVSVFFLLGYGENIFADKGYKLNERGNKEYVNKNYKSALNNYIRALSEREDPIIKYNLANSLYRMNDYDKAIDIYKKIEKQVPENIKPDLYYNLGNAYFKKKQYDKAVENYVNCLKIKPKDRYAKENLELALKKLKQQNQKNNKKQDEKQDKNNKDKNKQKENKDDKKNNDKNKEKKKQNKPQQQKKEKEKELKKLLKTLAEQEKIDRKKNREKGKRRKAVIDTMEKDW